MCGSSFDNFLLNFMVPLTPHRHYLMSVFPLYFISFVLEIGFFYSNFTSLSHFLRSQSRWILSSNQIFFNTKVIDNITLSDIRIFICPLPDQCCISLSGPSNTPTLRLFNALCFQPRFLLPFMDFSELDSFRPRVLALGVQLSNTVIFKFYRVRVSHAHLR